MVNRKKRNPKDSGDVKRLGEGSRESCEDFSWCGSSRIVEWVAGSTMARTVADCERIALGPLGRCGEFAKKTSVFLVLCGGEAPQCSDVGPFILGFFDNIYFILTIWLS